MLEILTRSHYAVYTRKTIGLHNTPGNTNYITGNPEFSIVVDLTMIPEMEDS